MNGTIARLVEFTAGAVIWTGLALAFFDGMIRVFLQILNRLVGQAGAIWVVQYRGSGSPSETCFILLVPFFGAGGAVGLPPGRRR